MSGSDADDEENGEGADLVPRTVDGQDLTPEDFAVLKGIARSLIRRVGESPTLNPTGLANDACARILASYTGPVQRLRMQALVARVMRNLLRDRARKQQTLKRDRGRVTLSTVNEPHTTQNVDVVDLEDALAIMERTSPKLYSVVELSYFGGMAQQEIAERLGIGERMVRVRLQMAVEWLRQRLNAHEAE